MQLDPMLSSPVVISFPSMHGMPNQDARPLGCFSLCSGMDLNRHGKSESAWHETMDGHARTQHRLRLALSMTAQNHGHVRTWHRLQMTSRNMMRPNMRLDGPCQNDMKTWAANAGPPGPHTDAVTAAAPPALIMTW